MLIADNIIIRSVIMPSPDQIGAKELTEDCMPKPIFSNRDFNMRQGADPDTAERLALKVLSLESEVKGLKQYMENIFAGHVLIDGQFRKITL